MCELVIDADGRVQWVGWSHVERIGQAEKQIDADEVRVLFETIVEFDLSQVPAHPDHPNCGEWHLEDGPVSLELEFADGTSVDVEDHHNCLGNATVERWRAIEDRVEVVDHGTVFHRHELEIVSGDCLAGSP